MMICVIAESHSAGLAEAEVGDNHLNLKLCCFCHLIDKSEFLLSFTTTVITTIIKDEGLKLWCLTVNLYHIHELTSKPWKWG